MKAWTYHSAPSAGWYWKTHGVPVVLVEHADGCLEWRVVETGAPHTLQSGIMDYHRAQQLPREQYPAWLVDLDDMGMDVGL